MANPQQQQYTEIVKQAQDAMLTAFETWTQTFQQALDELSTTAPDREHLIDQGFELRRQAGECSAECSAELHQAADGERHCGRQNRPGQCRLYDRSPPERFSSLKPDTARLLRGPQSTPHW